MSDTIFALSSGMLPAAIGVIRISGPAAQGALRALAERVPPPRRASLLPLRDAAGDPLDSAMVLWLPGPRTATGEDIVELHCHGGRAVITAVEATLAGMTELRRATAGEFTRRAFMNGRIDLAEAEGLADLLVAETELQRRSALAMAGGAFSRTIEDWRDDLLAISAMVEAILDFGDEDDVAALPPAFAGRLDSLLERIVDYAARPRAEMLREGVRVVLAGPPNVGKSTLFNALVESDAAITAPIAGTTRDVLTRPVAIEGVAFLFVDTAGLRDSAGDAIEEIGVARARGELGQADLVLWLGEEHQGPAGAWEIEPQIDRPERAIKSSPRHKLSALSGQGMDALRRDLVDTARGLLPKPGEAALSRHQHAILAGAAEALVDAAAESDPLLIAEQLRRARIAFDSLIGRAATENMLDALFGRFCIGK